MNRFLCRSSQWIERERVRPIAFAIRGGEYMPVTRDGSIRRAGERTPSGAWCKVGVYVDQHYCNEGER
jgi:hypothetical protein